MDDQLTQSNGEPIRIGYLLRMYPRFSQTFVVNEIRELERQGVDVRIASLRLPNEGIFHESITKVRAQAAYLEERFVGQMRSHLRTQWNLFRRKGRTYRDVVRIVRRHPGVRWFELCQAASLIRWAKKEGVRHVHVHFGTDEANVAMFAYLLGGPTYSLTLHAFDIFRENVDRALLVKKINASRFTVTVCHSNQTYLQGLDGINPEKVRVIYNGIDLELFTDAQLEREPNSIFGVGRLIEKKGFHDLIKAVAILRDQGLPVMCRIAGEGRDEKKLCGLIEKFGLDSQVTLLGSVRQDEVRRWMQRSSCFALPCIQAKDGNVDALPTVLLESLACGCPSVSTRLSGVPEIIEDEESGLLVEPGDVEALAKAIERILSHDETAKALSDGGIRRTAHRFDVRRNVAQLHEHFRMVLNADARRKKGKIPTDTEQPETTSQQEAA